MLFSLEIIRSFKSYLVHALFLKVVTRLHVSNTPGIFWMKGKPRQNKIWDSGNRFRYRERNKGKFKAATLLKAWSKTSQTAAEGKRLEGKASREKHGINRSFNKFGHVGNCTKWLWEQLESRNIISKQKMTKAQTKNMNKKKNVIRLHYLAW